MKACARCPFFSFSRRAEWLVITDTISTPGATRIHTSLLTGPRTSLVIVPRKAFRVLSFIGFSAQGLVKPYLTKTSRPCGLRRYARNAPASLLADVVNATGYTMGSCVLAGKLSTTRTLLSIRASLE